MDGELDQLGERIAEQAAHLDAAMHRLLTDLREFDARGGWYVQDAATCAHWLAWRVGWDLVTARDHLRVARKLAEFSQIDDALRRGEVSYSKVRVPWRRPPGCRPCRSWARVWNATATNRPATLTLPLCRFEHSFPDEGGAR